MSRRPEITHNTARTYRNDRNGSPITIDVKANSQKARITDAAGQQRVADYRQRKHAQHGFVVEKGYGYRVSQPKSVSKIQVLRGSIKR